MDMIGPRMVYQISSVERVNKIVEGNFAFLLDQPEGQDELDGLYG